MRWPLVAALIVLAGAVAAFVALRSAPTASGPIGRHGARTIDARTPGADEGPPGPSTTPPARRGVEGAKVPAAVDPQGHAHAGAPSELVELRVSVNDTRGQAVRAASLRLLDASGAAREEFETDTFGAAARTVDRRPGAVLVAEAPGFRGRSVPLDLLGPSDVVDMRVVLEDDPSAIVTGFVLDDGGAPLTEDRIGALMRLADAGVAGAIDPDLDRFPVQPFVVAHVADGVRQGSPWSVAPDPDTGAFSFAVGEDFEGFLSVVVLEQALVTVPWRRGFGPAILNVPGDALARAAGALRIEVVDAAGGQSLPGIQVLVEADRLDLRGPPQVMEYTTPENGAPLVVPGVPAVRCVISAFPESQRHAGTSADVVVAGGQETRIVLRLAAAASVRLWMHPESEGAAFVGADSLRYIDALGHDVDVEARIDFSAEPPYALEVGDAPSGPGAFVHDGNVLPVELRAGPNGDRSWTLRDSRQFTLLVPGPEAIAMLPEPVAHLELWRGSVPVLREDVALVLDGGVHSLTQWAVPGDYRLFLDYGIGNPYTFDVSVPEQDDVVIDLR